MGHSKELGAGRTQFFAREMRLWRKAGANYEGPNTENMGLVFLL